MREEESTSINNMEDIWKKISPSIESSRPPTPTDASPSDGGGGPGAFFLPNTLFIDEIFLSDR